MHPWAAQVSTSDYMQGWFAEILCLTSSTLCRSADNLKRLLHLFEPLSRSQDQMEYGEYRLRGEYDHTSDIRPQEAYFWDKFWSSPLSSLSKIQIANETHDISTRGIQINVDEVQGVQSSEVYILVCAICGIEEAVRSSTCETDESKAMQT